jgi:hypothetical protein
MTHRTRRRIGTVVLAPAAALGAWVFVRLLGIDLAVSTARGTVGAADVLVAALLAALVAWLVVRWLEGHSRRPRRLWAFVGSTALAVSMTGPSWLAESPASAVALMSLHAVTAVVVIAGFAPTVPLRRAAESGGTAFRPSVVAATEPSSRRRSRASRR